MDGRQSRADSNTGKSRWSKADSTSASSTERSAVPGISRRLETRPPHDIVETDDIQDQASGAGARGDWRRAPPALQIRRSAT